jgi:hypothetical protein
MIIGFYNFYIQNPQSKIRNQENELKHRCHKGNDL